MQVVERQVEVALPVPVTPARRDWLRLLQELARQIEDGRIYDRDLLDLSDALGTVYEAYRRRPRFAADRSSVSVRRGRGNERAAA